MKLTDLYIRHTGPGLEGQSAREKTPNQFSSLVMSDEIDENFKAYYFLRHIFHLSRTLHLYFTLIKLTLDEMFTNFFFTGVHRVTNSHRLAERPMYVLYDNNYDGPVC